MRLLNRLFQEIDTILAEIKAGDILNLYAAIWGVILLGAVIYLASKNIWAAVILLLLSPIPIFILTVLTKAVMGWFSKELKSFSKDNLETIPTSSDEFKKGPKDEVNISKSAWQICELAKEFAGAFRHIRDASTLDNEKETLDIFQTRQEIARMHLSKLIEIFKDIQYHLDCREELEQEIGRLINLFGKYSETLNFYFDMRAQQAIASPNISLPYGELNSFVDILFGDKATETLIEGDDIVKSIIRLLEPYVRWGSEQSLSQKLKYNINEVTVLMGKAIEYVNYYSDGYYPDGNFIVNLLKPDERHELAIDSRLKFSEYIEKNKLSFSTSERKLLKELDDLLWRYISITKIRITEKNFTKLAEDHAEHEILLANLQDKILEEFRQSLMKGDRDEIKI